MMEFIHMYRSFPCLWKVKSAEYADRDKKNKAFEELLKKWRDIDPSANLDLAKRKFDSIRGSFKKDLKKVNASKKSGASADDIYHSHLCYFTELLDILNRSGDTTGYFE
nr:unnamed protein product [Callosobruchus chinensis]